MGNYWNDNKIDSRRNRPTQFCKAIILQLKVNKFSIKKRRNRKTIKEVETEAALSTWKKFEGHSFIVLTMEQTLLLLLNIIPNCRKSGHFQLIYETHKSLKVKPKKIV